LYDCRGIARAIAFEDLQSALICRLQPRELAAMTRLSRT
jgi:hypothetical protein